MAVVVTANLVASGNPTSAADLADWVIDSGDWQVIASHLNASSAYSPPAMYYPGNTADPAEMHQDIDITPFTTAQEVDDGLVDYDFHFFTAGDSSTSDTAQAILEFYDGGMVLLGSDSTAPISQGDNAWVIQELDGTFPSGTETIRIRLIGNHVSGDSDIEAFFDNIHLQLRTHGPDIRQRGIRENLVAYLTFDEDSGDALEYAQGLESGTFENTADRDLAGQYGKAYESQAPGDFLEMVSYRALETDPVSVSAWVYADVLPSAMFGVTPRVIVALDDGTNGGYFLGVMAGDTVTFRVVDLAFSVYEATYTMVPGDVGQWIHFVGVQRSNRIFLYKDGVLQDDNLVSGDVKFDGGIPLVVGRDWEGRIDEVKIWSKELVTLNSEGFNEILLAAEQQQALDTTGIDYVELDPEIGYVDLTFQPNHLEAFHEFGDPDRYLVGGGPTVSLSRNGVDWENAFTAAGGNVTDSVARQDLQVSSFDRVNWVVTLDNGHVLTSRHGDTWTDQGDVTGAGAALNCVAYGDELFVAAGANGTVLRSDDGVDWTSATSGFGLDDIMSVLWTGTLWVAVGEGGRIHTSPDAISWTSRANPIAGTIRGITWNGYTDASKVLVAVGDGGEIIDSPDGITWDSLVSPTVGTLNDVHFSHGSWVAVGSGGEVLVSVGSDAQGAWGSTNVAVPGDLLSVYRNSQGLWVASGEDAIITSEDLSAWVVQVSPFPGSTMITGAFASAVVIDTYFIYGLVDFTEGPFFQIDYQELQYTDSPFVPVRIPRDPEPVLSSTTYTFSGPTNNLSSVVDYGSSEPVSVRRFWEIKVSETMYIRLEDERPIAIPGDESTQLALDFDIPVSIDLNGAMLRYVIEPQEYAGEIIWASPWVTIGTGGGGGPPPGGSGTASYAPLVFVHIFDTEFIGGGQYLINHEPDVDTDTATRYYWQKFCMDGDDPIECSPNIVDPSLKKLVLETLEQGRFRYRFSARYADGTSAHQDFVLLVYNEDREV